MSKTILFIPLAALICSCSSYKSVSYKYTDLDANRLTELSVKIPKGFKKNEINTIEGTEIQLVYPDSSMIFISNNHLSGSISNKKNRLNKGIDVIFKDKYNDTLVLNGSTKSGLLWEEYFLNNIIIGYLNVAEKRQKEYQAIFSNIEIKKQLN